ncbi:MAG: hypothetical protein CL610_01050 [Anaerolineaceae bacterium]|nr:hypothetical protein [Anaerolineaceae bacterium]
MPGRAISNHLEAGTEEAFNQVAQVFRHDLVLYAGMLQSWMSLFEIEVPEDQLIFARMTRYMAQATDQFLKEMQPRLYPQYAAPSRASHAHICETWDSFYEDFVAYAQPKLMRMGSYMRVYMHRPEFNDILQANLGPVADDEHIDKMLMSTYNKLSALLDANQFNQRIAVTLQASKSARMGS